jgi:hypothetical protein
MEDIGQYTGGYAADGSRSGRGRIVWSNGDEYEGDFAHGCREGWGEMREASGVHYAGCWVASQRHGRGKQTYVDGSVYEGDFCKDTSQGMGTLSSRTVSYRGALRHLPSSLSIR